MSRKSKGIQKGIRRRGEFMPKPKEGKKPIPARKVFNLNLSPVKADIDGHRLALNFSNTGRSVDITFTVDGGVTTKEGVTSSAKKRIALWWRRSAVEALQMMPDGVPLGATAYSGDGRGEDRSKFYRSLGFSVEDGVATGITKKGKVVPPSLGDTESASRTKIKDGRTFAEDTLLREGEARRDIFNRNLAVRASAERQQEAEILRVATEARDRNREARRLAEEEEEREWMEDQARQEEESRLMQERIRQMEEDIDRRIR